jgi:outer membrane protein W
MKRFIYLFVATILTATNATAQGGFFLKRTGVELGVRPGTDIIYKENAPFYSKTRIGGKLENFCIGASYINENAFYYGKTTGWAADLGYDIHFGKGWGLNVALEYMAITTNHAPEYTTTRIATEDNVFLLPLYFYKQFDVSDKFFIKPTFGIYSGYRNGKITYYREDVPLGGGTPVPSVNTYDISGFAGVNLHGGIGFGYNINDKLALGAMPMYVPYANKNVWGLQLSAGYNFYTEESFDGKAKR